MKDSISLAAIKLTRTAPVLMGITMKFRRDEMRFTMKKTKCLPRGIHQFYDSIDDEECRRDTLKDLYETTNIPEAIGYYNTRHEIDFIADQTLLTEAHNDDST